MGDIVENLRNDAICEIQDLALPFFRRPYLSLMLHGQKIKGLYDTGADVSCLDERVFRKIPIELRPDKLSSNRIPNFRSATGNSLQVKGKYRFELTVGERKLSHTFYVVQGLSEALILGIDFIQHHQLNYCTENRSFTWKKRGDWIRGQGKTRQVETLEGLSISQVKLKVNTDNGCIPQTGTPCMVNLVMENAPGIMGGPFLSEVDHEGNVVVPVTNCCPSIFEIERGICIGMIENVSECEMRELNPRFVSSIREKEVETKLNKPLSEAKKKFITENAKLDTVPEKFRSKYLQLLLKYHEAISQHKFDLGRSETLLHDIALKSEEPIYVKQFKIPDAHREEVERHVAEWLKLGVVQPCRSKFNSPLFVVMKKNGGVRLVQDFRALNAQTYVDKYSMKDVSECISEIGRSGSTIFTTIDLTAGFWQMLLHPRSRPYTAFTLPGKGQFQWVTSPMGLLGSPSSFQRLMETVMHSIENVLVYIDDLLLHSHDHESHLQTFEKVLERMVQHGIKLNLEKCVFGSKEVGYLGFRLTETGIKPGIDKLKAVAKAPAPTSVKEVRQFLGLCNFFRNHVRNFSQISAPLTEMTKKECHWKGGELPAKAMTAFRELQSYLCSEPIIDFPRRDRAYALITDASLGDDKKAGGLGAILAQIDKKGEFYAVAYASRGLQKHEKNYTPFLLEMQASIWGMDHFSTYLRGRHFTLFTDHKPLEKLGKVHTKTLNRLQEAMNQFDFDIIYKKGSEMPADFLSRNIVAAVGLTNEQLISEQNQDPVIKALKDFLLNRALPRDSNQQQVIMKLAMECFIEDDLVWRRLKRSFEPSRVVLFLPRTLKQEVLEQAHGSLMGGHDGILKTKERILSCYYWNGMDKDINDFIKKCHKCQVRRPSSNHSPALLTPLPQGTEPNQRVHADLFGPLRVSGNSKKFILCITDAFTKYVELVALENKEAATVSEAIFSRWFCRYGIPAEIITDQGKEFCARVSEDLFKRLGALHTTTSPHHPQCNSQAEVANKTIAKYLSSFVDDTTLDWENYLAPLMFCYNTSFHRSIKTTPFFVTFGVEPRQPGFPQSDIRRKFYGETSTDELMHRLRLAREVAKQNNEAATHEAENYYNKQAAPHQFKIGELVLLNETYFLNRNAKLAPKWTGPHRVAQLKGQNNAEIVLCHNNKKLVVHTDRLKKYHAYQTDPIDFPDLQIESEKKENSRRPRDSNPVRPPPATFEADDYNFREEDAREKFEAPHRQDHVPSKFASPRQSHVSRQMENLLPQSERPSNILVRLGPPPPPIFQTGGGNDGAINEIGEAIKFAAKFDEIKDDDEGWILVTRKSRRRRVVNKDNWSAQQRKNFALTGDLYQSPSEFPASQWTYEDEDDNIPQVQPQPALLPNPQLQVVQPPPPPVNVAIQQPIVAGYQQGQAQVQALPQPAAVLPGAGAAGQHPPPHQGAAAPLLGPTKDSSGRSASGTRLPSDRRVLQGDQGRAPGDLQSGSAFIHPRSLSTGSAESFARQRSGSSDILHRLQSPVRHGQPTVVPGLPTGLPASFVPVHQEGGAEHRPSRTRIRTDIGLKEQGWSSDPDTSTCPSREAGHRPVDRDSQDRFSPGSSEDSSYTDHSESSDRDPEAHSTPGGSQQGETAVHQGGRAQKSRLEAPARTSGSPIYANLDPRVPSDQRKLPEAAQPQACGGARPKSILKTGSARAGSKNVQYSLSTKKGSPRRSRTKVSSAPQAPARSSEPDISVRPTSHFDIVDEILAGEPSKVKKGKTIPDTLLKVKPKVPPTDRKLRSDPSNSQKPKK